jgi:transcription initiation factor IIE alpha subunit
MTSLAFALFGGTKALNRETKESAITKLTNDLKRDLKLIKSGSYYFCTGDAPKYCYDCKRAYPYLR